MKKIVVSWCLLVFVIVYAVCETKTNSIILDGFSIHQIQKNSYTLKDNWDDIVKDNGRLYLYYKVDTFRDYKYIAEIYYILINQHDEKKILGSFSRKTGFLDANGTNFTRRYGVNMNTDFMKKHLLGLSLEMLEHPFTINGFALDYQDEPYETEVMEMFSIDTENITIEEWFPEW
ncbi:MAG: hypothetical protein P1P65_04560 [Treponema sp.]